MSIDKQKILLLDIIGNVDTGLINNLQAPIVEPMWYLCESVMLGPRGETC